MATEQGGLDDDVPSSVTGLDEDEDVNVSTSDKIAHPYDAITITSALALLVGRDRLADVRFAVGKGDDKRIIPAHRVVLAASSALFESMLYPPQFPDDDHKHGDVISIDKQQIIDVPDCKPAAFKVMLQCLYSDTCSIRAEDLPDIIHCANKYQLEPLRQQIAKFMASGVTIENACTLYTTAYELLHEPQLAVTFIEENASDIFHSPGFDSLSGARLASLLESDFLCIDEIEIFNAVLRWSLAACKRAHLTDTIEHRRQVLAPVIPRIRFPLISMEEIATIVAPTQILTPQQLLEIFTWLGQPESAKPPCPYPTTPRTGARAKWALNPAYKSSNSTLSNDNHTFTHNGGSHSYILGDMEMSKGIHAWRIVRDSGQSQWLLVGMSTRKSYSDASYNDSGVWALSSASQQYMAGVTGSQTTNFATGPLDCTFNADEGTLAILNLSTNVNVTLTGLPKNQPLVPHFGPHSHQQITVWPIRLKDVGNQGCNVGKR